MDPEETYSTDFSFQVAIGLENFFANKAAPMGSQWTSKYQLNRAEIA
jgi:hypothetical protein